MFIFSNLAISLDGKINTKDRDALFYLGTEEDRRQMIRLRRECDAILMGASTLRSFKKPCLAWGKDADVTQTEPCNVILSSKLQGIDPDWPFFKSRRIRRILVVGPDAPARSLRKFEKTCEIIRLGKATRKSPTAMQVVRALEERGVKRLLVEGGGGVMWDFVSRNLIDEYHVTLTPKLIGGIEAPTLVDGEGFLPAEVLSLRLEQCRIVGQELYLIYRKDRT